MYTTTRRVGESVTLTLPTGEVIRLSVVGVAKSKCKIGVEAPQSVRIRVERVDGGHTPRGPTAA